MTPNKNGRRPFWLFLYSLAMLGFHATTTSARSTFFPNLPALYIFGDSLVDVGTNNYLKNCKAKADMPLNGIDFPGAKATGRFSNGQNLADYIAQPLGFPQSPPAFFSLLDKKKNLRNGRTPRDLGVNFASGGAGIMDDTGELLWGRVIPLRKQIKQFKTVRNDLTRSYGVNGTRHISKSMFIFSVGSNDLFQLYAAHNYSVPAKTQSKYMKKLVSTFRGHLKAMYKLGARKFAVIGTPALGCVPIIRRRDPNGDCLESMNKYSYLFFSSVQPLLLQLSNELKGMQYSVGNTYTVTHMMMQNQKELGFFNLAEACCGKGRLNADERCDNDANMCLFRDNYVFWDQYHPSQASAKLLGAYLCVGAPFLVTPMSFAQLAMA